MVIFKTLIFSFIVLVQFQFRDSGLETDVEFAQNVIKTIRSIRADYMLVPKMKIESESLPLCSVLIQYVCGLISPPPPHLLPSTSPLHT